MSNIQVTLDERIRLVTAVLAASDWPEIEQRDRPHAVHTHSKQTMQHVSSFKGHAAVRFVNDALRVGTPLNTLLDIIVRCEPPAYTPKQSLPALDGAAEWATAAAGFAIESKIGAFWEEHNEVWQTAVSECKTIFAESTLPRLMAQLTGEQRTVQLMPSLVFPMLDPAVAKVNKTTTILLPPLKAWGESPPWPYKEDPLWVAVGAAKGLLADALAPLTTSLTVEQRATLVQAAVALSLGQLFDEFERQAYVVRIKKEESLPALPTITSKLRDWLDAGAVGAVTAVFS